MDVPMNRAAGAVRIAACAGVFWAIAPGTTHAQTAVDWATALSGDWTTAGNWSPSVVPDNGQPLPGDTYDATINATGAAYTVTLDGPITIENLTLDSLDATLLHDTGVFTANAGIDLLAGTYQLSGATVSDTPINLAGGELDFSNSSANIFSGVTVTGTLALDTPTARVRLLNGSTIGGADLTGDGAYLGWQQNSTLDTTVNLDGASSRLALEGNSTLTVGATGVVNLNAANSDLGAAFLFSGDNALVNQGTITADGTAGGSKNRTINPDDFTNEGTVAANNGAVLNLNTVNDSITNLAGAVYQLDQSTLNIEGGSGTLDLPTGTTLSGNGLINATVITDGDVVPGPTTGVLRVEDGLTLTTNSSTVIELGGAIAGDAITGFDVLETGGLMTLSGDIEVNLINGFTPVEGNIFRFLVAEGGFSGSFDSLTLPTFDPSLIVRFVQEPTYWEIQILPPGDYDASGFVGQDDLNLVLLNWGQTSLPSNFITETLPGGAPFDGLIGQNELNGVLLNWGRGIQASESPVPEPAAASLLMASSALLLRRR